MLDKLLILVLGVYAIWSLMSVWRRARTMRENSNDSDQSINRMSNAMSVSNALRILGGVVLVLILFLLR